MCKPICIECKSELHTYQQAAGPYVRSEAGDIVAMGRITLMECHNPVCRLRMVTASEKTYNETVGNYLTWLQSKAACHA